MAQTASSAQKVLRQSIIKSKSKDLARFFKTKKGEYGEGDKFLGVMVPDIRKTAIQFKHLSLKEIQKLLKSQWHEERLLGLIILTLKYPDSNLKEKNDIFNFYLFNTQYINNWDLVDLSAHKIIGQYLYKYKKDRNILKKLAHSKNIWERRIAIISTFYFIYKGECNDPLKIAEILISDTHDLIHKAVGWMLREVGKRCGQEKEEEFLKKYYKEMPRTMLRYAIEKFSSKKRKGYLSGRI